MILLNQPWNIYERQMELERRRQVARRACISFIWALAGVALGIGLGVVFVRPII